MAFVDKLLAESTSDRALLLKNITSGDHPEVPRAVDFVVNAREEKDAQLFCHFVTDNHYGQPTYEKVVREDEVPAVAAVFAAVGDDVAGQPLAVFTRLRQQVTAATAVDAIDGGFRLQHTRSLAPMKAGTACA